MKCLYVPFLHNRHPSPFPKQAAQEVISTALIQVRPCHYSALFVLFLEDFVQSVAHIHVVAFLMMVMVVGMSCFLVDDGGGVVVDQLRV